MWLGSFNRVDLYLSGANLSWRTRDAHEVLSLGPANPWQSAVKELMERAPLGSRWHVWLGGCMCRLSYETPIEGIGRLEDAEVALGLAAQADGNEAPKWSFRLNAWPQRGKGWVAAAVPTSLVEEMESMLRSKRQQLRSVKPWWSLPSKRLKEDVVMVDDEAITYWRFDDKRRVREAVTLAPLTVEQQRAAVIARLTAGGAVRRCDLVLGVGTGDQSFSWQLQAEAESRA